MRARLIAADAYRVMRWRNGQGTTTEIAVELEGGEPEGAARFRWRLSIADVAASGPFSDFTGYDRVIAVVSGAGMRLAVTGRTPVELTQTSPPYAFPGDAATECTLLDGPIRDFNLMTDRATARGTVTALRFTQGSETVSLAGGIALLHAVRGGLTVDGVGSRTIVPEGATLRIDEARGPLAVAGAVAGYALLAEIVPV